MIALHADLLDFPHAPAWGETGPQAVRWRPDHWLLVGDDGRIAAVQSSEPGPEWQRQDHRGRLLMPGFIDTHVHSPQLDVIASYGTELLDWLHTYTFPAERGLGRPARWRRAARRSSSMPCWPTAPPRRWSFPPCTRARPTPCSRRPASAACASSPARC